MFSLFGSCRIHNVGNNNYLNMELTFTHNTKEVIQFIKFLREEKEMPPPYDRLCFRTPIDEKWSNGVILSEEQKHKFKTTKVFVIEICSRKKYIHNGYYLHHLAIDNRFPPCEIIPENIKKEVEIIKQTDKEIEEDIDNILSLVHPTKIVIVSHYNAKLNGEYIPERNNLINLLEDICHRKNIPFINPTVVLKDITQEQAVLVDLGHYTRMAQNIMKDYIYNFCINLS